MSEDVTKLREGQVNKCFDLISSIYYLIIFFLVGSETLIGNYLTFILAFIFKAKLIDLLTPKEEEEEDDKGRWKGNVPLG